MSVISRRLYVATAAVVMTLGLSFPATADDFAKECKIGNPGADSDKVCGCMSDKITGAGRADAVEAMNKTNTAMAKGAAADPNTMTPKVMKSMEAVMAAQIACM